MQGIPSGPERFLRAKKKKKVAKLALGVEHMVGSYEQLSNRIDELVSRLRPTDLESARSWGVS